MKNLISFLGQVLFALPFIVFGVNHFFNGTAMSGMIPSYMPFPMFWVYFTGLAIIAAAISIIINKYSRVAGLLLALFLLLMVLLLHIPAMGKPETMQMGMISMLKDLALAGGAIFISQYNKG